MAFPTLRGKWEGLLFLLGTLWWNELSRAAGGILTAANGTVKWTICSSGQSGWIVSSWAYSHKDRESQEQTVNTEVCHGDR